MKIIFSELGEQQHKFFKSNLSEHGLLFLNQPIQDLLVPDAETEVLACFVNSKIDPVVLDKLPNLKLIAAMSTGYDHIDISECKKRGILVCNVPSYGENTVAEFTFALILAQTRKIYPAIKRVRENGEFSTEGFSGFDLKDKTLGVVGTGKIGKHVIRMAKGFEMNVVAYDPHENNELASSYGFKYASLDELLKISDIVTLHVPYLPATHHLINAEKFRLFKPSAILINTARGAVIDTQSLIMALVNKQISGAALDVLEEEGLVVDELSLLSGHPNEQQLKTSLINHELMHMDNVIVTPHNAFNTKEALDRIFQTTAENIKSFVSNTPINLV